MTYFHMINWCLPVLCAVFLWHLGASSETRNTLRLGKPKAKHRVETFMQKKLCAIKTSQKFFTTSHFFTSTFVQWDDTFEYLLRDKTYLPKPCRYLQPTLKGINILLFSKRSSRTMEMNKIQHLSVYLEDLK